MKFLYTMTFYQFVLYCTMSPPIMSCNQSINTHTQLALESGMNQEAFILSRVITNLYF